MSRISGRPRSSTTAGENTRGRSGPSRARDTGAPLNGPRQFFHQCNPQFSQAVTRRERISKHVVDVIIKSSARPALTTGSRAPTTLPLSRVNRSIAREHAREIATVSSCVYRVNVRFPSFLLLQRRGSLPRARRKLGIASTRRSSQDRG